MDYRLVIRGTASDINVSEDLDVLEQVSWRKWDKGAPDGAKIAKGTGIALDYIIDNTSNNQPGQGSTIFSFIENNISKQPNATLSVVGHSLGGVLASTLALLLKNKYLPIFDDLLKINCCAFAGPTAGNRIFAEYSERIFNSSKRNPRIYTSDFIRVANEQDIVPNAWNFESIKNLKNIYPGVKMPFELSLMIDLVYLPKLKKIDQYIQLNPSIVHTITAPVEIVKWAKLASYHHINAYPEIYEMSFKNAEDGEEIPSADIVVDRGGWGDLRLF